MPGAIVSRTNHPGSHLADIVEPDRAVAPLGLDSPMLMEAASPSDLRLCADVVAAVESMGYQRARGFRDDRPFLVGVFDYEGTDCAAHIHVLDADSAKAVGQRGLAAALRQDASLRG